MLQILRYVEKALKRKEKIAADVAILFQGDLNPVAPKAQKKVAVPEGFIVVFKCLSVCLCVCLYLCMSVPLYVYMYVCMYICMYVYLYVCLSV